MTTIKISFVELHNPLFMQGTNLGNKINAAQRGASIQFDLDRKLLIITFKGKCAIIPDSNVASMDVIDLADLGLEFKTEAPTAPEATVKRGRGRPPVNPEPVAQSEEDRRAAARAASANAFKPEPKVETTGSKLIEQSRAIAAGKAQVSDPTKPAQGLTGLSSAPKMMSHAELKAKVAAEKQPE